MSQETNEAKQKTGQPSAAAPGSDVRPELKPWLARRNGICRGVYGPHRIEYRQEFVRISGKPICDTCFRAMSEAQQNGKLTHG